MDNFIHENNLYILQEITEKVNEKYKEISPDFSDIELSNLLFGKTKKKDNNKIIPAHVQAIKKQLDLINEESFEKNRVVIHEFCSSIAWFNRFNNTFQLNGGTYRSNYLTSRDCYVDALQAIRSMPQFYQGSIEFARIPVMLRLAIEIHFKNMLGIQAVYQKKGEAEDRYDISISNLLDFFGKAAGKKFCNLPIDIQIIQNINYWSNSFIHSGVLNYAWQSLQAIDFLAPLFKIEHENGGYSLEGYNYLSPDFSQDEIIKDLENFLSHKRKNIQIRIDYEKFSEEPLEGQFYYPRRKKL